jgi:hypothetical protein
MEKHFFTKKNNLFDGHLYNIFKARFSPPGEIEFINYLNKLIWNN